MGGFITDAEWAEYANDINSFHDDAFQQEIIWHKAIRTLSKDGDEQPQYRPDIVLKGLIAYNQFRSWPINSDTILGEVDKESCLLYMNLAYLEREGYTNDKGQFKFKPASDKFTVDGVRYKSKGDSKSAQAKDKSLLVFLVLKRDYTDTPEDKY